MVNGYPRVKYHKDKLPVKVADENEEKALGEGWFDHPVDAKAGRELTSERGDPNFDPEAALPVKEKKAASAPVPKP